MFNYIEILGSYPNNVNIILSHHIFYSKLAFLTFNFVIKSNEIPCYQQCHFAEVHAKLMLLIIF